ncbi:TetM/TetW/TetO/TetS family tetracycline resistance ribosomal protection protein [Kibdelosporangium philippinense]|uniref:TetM/TetW/TetO/TetS family tetracycline resistance ribosomal protection protein n=1 Tax=Kibdelosporangium philippinense TaxID=211113 RepID=A0ABS8ZAA0_9PSEU|nr:TetM/TetW/TetO/TetS family tetracycline resistance ribosomal protection protein [Kibdelosporangium philippinense]MCE7004800.1 TetM/TetW/TetO/TetS family tetracycline resistance ribosomal protection protein [Kibdelosporangium philippinense]
MLNLGIVAHVDAGKTSLTERLLFDSGAITRLGSVDGGDTRTDAMAIERRRGITIRSAVATFSIAGRTVHLIDTPGHTDFVAEVERALGVLDGAILVLSAVEGVQPHTRVLMRTLQSLGVPTILFVNKIDRRGARYIDLLDDIRRMLSPSVIPLNSPSELAMTRLGSQAAEVLAEHSDAVLQSYVDGLDPRLLHRELVRQTGEALVHPVLFGSAITGAGTEALGQAIVDLLPTVDPAATGELDGTVFAVEHAGGRRFAIARLFSGELKVRDQVTFVRQDASGTTVHSSRATEVLDADRAQTTIRAGGIARIGGIPGLRVGDRLGSTASKRKQARFRPPTFQTMVTSSDQNLYAGLSHLADEDPLIDMKPGPTPGSLLVSLYGEVQREVIAARLAEEFGVTAEFSPSTVVCVERLKGTGHAVKRMGETLFVGTVGLRIEPGEADSGIQYQLEAERGSLPAAFMTAIEDTVRATLATGRHGWQVVDCLVTLTHTGYSSPVTVAADFRNLTPLVVMQALANAGTVVCEPIEQADIDIPADAVSTVLNLLVRCGGTPEMPVVRGDSATVRAVVPSRQLRAVEQSLPGLTNGYGTLIARFAGYRPIAPLGRLRSMGP